MNNTSPLHRTIEQLNELLLEETEALRSLDHLALEEITTKKLTLVSGLGDLDRKDASKETLRLLTSVRRRALNNQMLMVHARDLTKGVFERLTNSHSQSHSPSGAPPARLLEVRG